MSSFNPFGSDTGPLSASDGAYNPFLVNDQAFPPTSPLPSPTTSASDLFATRPLSPHSLASSTSVFDPFADLGDSTDDLPPPENFSLPPSAPISNQLFAPPPVKLTVPNIRPTAPPASAPAFDITPSFAPSFVPSGSAAPAMPLNPPNVAPSPSHTSVLALPSAAPSGPLYPPVVVASAWTANFADSALTQLTPPPSATPLVPPGTPISASTPAPLQLASSPSPVHQAISPKSLPLPPSQSESAPKFALASPPQFNLSHSSPSSSLPGASFSSTSPSYASDPSRSPPVAKVSPTSIPAMNSTSNANTNAKSISSRIEMVDRNVTTFHTAVQRMTDVSGASCASAEQSAHEAGQTQQALSKWLTFHGSHADAPLVTALLTRLSATLALYSAKHAFLAQGGRTCTVLWLDTAVSAPLRAMLSWHKHHSLGVGFFSYSTTAALRATIEQCSTLMRSNCVSIRVAVNASEPGTGIALATELHAALRALPAPLCDTRLLVLLSPTAVVAPPASLLHARTCFTSELTQAQRYALGEDIASSPRSGSPVQPPRGITSSSGYNTPPARPSSGSFPAPLPSPQSLAATPLSALAPTPAAPPNAGANGTSAPVKRVTVLASGSEKRLSTNMRSAPTFRSWKGRMKESNKKITIWLDLDDDSVRLLSEDRAMLHRVVPLRHVAMCWLGVNGVMFKWNLGNGIQSDVIKTKHAKAIVDEIGQLWQAMLRKHEAQMKAKAAAQAAP